MNVVHPPLVTDPNESRGKTKKRKGQKMARGASDIRGPSNAHQPATAELDVGLSTEIELTDDDYPQLKKQKTVRPEPLRRTG